MEKRHLTEDEIAKECIFLIQHFKEEHISVPDALTIILVTTTTIEKAIEEINDKKHLN